MKISPYWSTVLFALLFLSVPSISFATKIASVDLDTLLTEAQIVALVTITEGELNENAQRCGARFTGVVSNALKNVEKETKLSFLSRFVSHSQLEMGAQYIVFLNSLSHANVTGCKNAVLEVAQAGYGALRVAGPYQIDLEDAVRVPLSFIKLPPSLRPVPGASSNLEVYESGWVDKQSFINYIHGQAK